MIVQIINSFMGCPKYLQNLIFFLVDFLIDIQLPNINKFLFLSNLIDLCYSIWIWNIVLCIIGLLYHQIKGLASRLRLFPLPLILLLLKVCLFIRGVNINNTIL